MAATICSSAGIRRYLDGCGPAQHMIGNIVVWKDANGLVSRAAVRAVHRSRVTENMLTTIGNYRARWFAGEGGWNVLHWRMEIAFNHGNPAVFGMGE